MLRSLLPLTLIVAATLVVSAGAQEKTKDTPKAVAMRKVLKKKITVDLKDTRLEEAMEEIKELARGFGYLLDTKGGVSRNQQMTFKGKDKTVEEVLDGMFSKVGLGYIVISDPKDPYDGRVKIKQGKERGYPLKR